MSYSQRHDARKAAESYDEAHEPTKAQIRRWAKRAETIHRKACDLFEEVEAALGEEHGMTSTAAVVMCEAGAMANWGLKG